MDATESGTNNLKDVDLLDLFRNFNKIIQDQENEPFKYTLKAAMNKMQMVESDRNIVWAVADSQVFQKILRTPPINGSTAGLFRESMSKLNKNPETRIGRLVSKLVKRLKPSNRDNMKTSHQDATITQLELSNKKAELVAFKGVKIKGKEFSKAGAIGEEIVYHEKKQSGVHIQWGSRRVSSDGTLSSITDYLYLQLESIGETKTPVSAFNCSSPQQYFQSLPENSKTHLLKYAAVDEINTKLIPNPISHVYAQIQVEIRCNNIQKGILTLITPTEIVDIDHQFDQGFDKEIETMLDWYFKIFVPKLVDGKLDVGLMRRITSYKCCDVPGVQCTEVFTSPSLFRQHMKLKHKIRCPFPCPVCFQKFTTKSNMIAHLKHHDADITIPCPVCFQKFKRKSTMIFHLKNHATDTRIPCPVCFKKFNRKRDMIFHLKHHAADTKIPCPVCFKKFTQKATMIFHLKNHAADNRISCPVCFQKFTQKSTMIFHLKNHDADIRIPCPVCFDKFTQKCHMISHLKKHAAVKI